ncbi:MAG: cytochrome c biosis protein CcsA [Bacteroidota bacterium]
MKIYNQFWWKGITIVLLIYTIIAGFMMKVPSMDILNETIRNLYFHVPMWFGQITLYTIGVVYSIKYLLITPSENLSTENKFKFDIIARSAIAVGTLMGCLGLLTGMIWANYTWGKPWSDDPKLNCTAIGMLIYFAYFILRGSMDDVDKKAKLAATFNIFSYVLFVVLIFVIPRMKEFSIHPGNGGNPAFAKYDLDRNMRLVFYPAVLAWIFLGIWITTLVIRIENIKLKLAFKD